MIGKTNSRGGVSAPVPKIKTVSGSVISISDALARSAVSLVADINAVQSGSGDPSPLNVRPISGWSAVNVWRTGKNLLLIDNAHIQKPTQFTGNWEIVTLYGNGFISHKRSASGGYGGVWCFIKAGTYKLSYDIDLTNAEGSAGNIYFAPTGETASSIYSLSANTATNRSVTLTVEKDGVLMFRPCASVWRSGAVAEIAFTNIQIELGSTATAYESYNGNTYTIQLGQTVYGGSLDVTTGVLTVDMATIDLGSLSWTYYTSQQIPMFYADISGGKVYPTGTSVKAYCSDYKVESNSMSASNFAGLGYFHAAFNGAATSRVLISDSRYTDKDTFKTAMSGVQFVYELATPQTIQLSPTTVQMLLGNNVLWADSGNSELQYWSGR